LTRNGNDPQGVAQEARSKSSRPDQFSQYLLPFVRSEGKNILRIERELEPNSQVHKIAGRNLLNPSMGFALTGTRKAIPDGFFDRQSAATTTRRARSRMRSVNPLVPTILIKRRDMS